MTAERKLKLKDRWKQLDIDELKKIIAAAPLIAMYKKGGEPIHQIWRKKWWKTNIQYDFDTKQVSRNLHMVRFGYAGERRQNRSPDKLQPIRDIFDLWNSIL